MRPPKLYTAPPQRDRAVIRARRRRMSDGVIAAVYVFGAFAGLGFLCLLWWLVR